MNSGSWSSFYVGERGFTDSNTYFQNLAFANGNAIVAFENCSNRCRTGVMRFYAQNSITSGAWTPVGDQNSISAGGAEYQSIAVDENKNIYVGFCDKGVLNGTLCRARVVRFDGAAWHDIGALYNQTKNVAYVSLVIYKGTPYVAYQDQSEQNRAVVKMYNGTTWVDAGSYASLPTHTSYESLKVYNGKLYLAFSLEDHDGRPNGQSGKAMVMSLDLN